MPYRTNADLPAALQRRLPPHAQDIYREAFNNAWERYGEDEQTAFRVAWAAVKRLYEPTDAGWVPRHP
ncbi:MAG TPA: ChaB family protein [Myxococcales bacterium]|nr:ChaB family protein [Myxococcales bacterium]